MGITNIKNSSSIGNHNFNVDGVVNADNGNFEEALRYFNKAIELDPKNYVSYFNRASIRMHFGDIQGARHDFMECEKLHENNSLLI